MFCSCLLQYLCLFHVVEIVDEDFHNHISKDWRNSKTTRDTNLSISSNRPLGSLVGAIVVVVGCMGALAIGVIGGLILLVAAAGYGVAFGGGFVAGNGCLAPGMVTT